MKVTRAAVLAAALAAACGKKGPPLPPLVRLPAAPDVKAARRGSTVDLQVTVPRVNTDGSRPANVERVDVYGFTGPPTLSDTELLKRATRIGSLPVKTPRDPEDTAEADEPQAEVEAPTGTGLDQGAVGHIEEQLDAVSPRSSSEAPSGRIEASPTAGAGPLLGPMSATPSRTYVGVGVNKSGRKGQLSPRVMVPLGFAPPPPADVTMSYTEKAVTLAWSSPARVSAAAGDVLPARPIGVAFPSLAFNVYDANEGILLNKMPLSDTRFEDARIEWGEERCYRVRTVAVAGSLSIESDAPPPVCDTLVDSFPPAVPKGLRVIATNGAMNLIWDANTEPDLAGYVVLRGVVPGGQLEPLMSMPIREAMYTDTVQPGTRYVYAVRAVDTSGNESDASAPQEETAR